MGLMSFRFFTRFRVGLCLAASLIPSFGSVPGAVADVAWLEEVSDCAGFRTELEKFYSTLGELREISASQHAELASVLSAACGPRFAECEFEICSERNRTKTETTAEKPVRPVTIESDPLAWLKQPLTCGELVEQFQARFGPLGRISDIRGEKKKELEQVLRVSCSKRFLHCNFSTCVRRDGERAPSVDEDSPLAPIAPEVKQAMSEQSYLELVKEQRSRRERMIELKRMEEKSTQVVWQEFQISLENESRESGSEEEDVEQPQSRSGTKFIRRSGTGSSSKWGNSRSGSALPDRSRYKVKEEYEPKPRPYPTPR